MQKFDPTPLYAIGFSNSYEFFETFAKTKAVALENAERAFEKRSSLGEILLTLPVAKIEIAVLDTVHLLPLHNGGKFAVVRSCEVLEYTAHDGSVLSPCDFKRR